MARKPTRRPGRPVPKSGTGRSLFPPIEDHRKTIKGPGGDKIIKTTYTMKIPRALRGVTAQTQEAKEIAARRIAKEIAAKARLKHGEGIGAYRARHFFATFSGTMYEEDDRESEKMGRATFGTGAKDDLKTVEDELEDRILALLEGETPQRSGPKSAYGYFASGVSSVEMIVMERPDEIEKEAKRKAKRSRR